jgi:hypothetical protein
MEYKIVKIYVFSNWHICCYRSSKRYKEARVIADTILEAKKKVRKSGHRDLKFERIVTTYERT